MTVREPDPETIQYAHGGRWHVMEGHGTPADGLRARVDRDNARDGWTRWRIAPASTDRESGAPHEPEGPPRPMPDAIATELLDLGRRRDAGLTADEDARLSDVLVAYGRPRTDGGVVAALDRLAKRSAA